MIPRVNLSTVLQNFGREFSRRHPRIGPGAFLPFYMWRLPDLYSMRVGFVMTQLCFCFIAFYGFSWRKLYRRDLEPGKARELSVGGIDRHIGQGES